MHFYIDQRLVSLNFYAFEHETYLPDC